MLEGTEEEIRQIAVSLSKVERPILAVGGEDMQRAIESGRGSTPATIEVFEGKILQKSKDKESTRRQRTGEMSKLQKPDKVHQIESSQE